MPLGSLRRIRQVAGLELTLHLRRPLVYLYLASAAAMSWATTEPHFFRLPTDSSDASAWSTSEFAVAWVFTSGLAFALHALFASILVTSSMLRETEHRTEELIHTTPLTAVELVWGKLTGLLAVLGLIVLGHALLHGSIHHLGVAGDEHEAFRGPFLWRAYLVPALAFLTPGLALVTALCTVLTVRFRRFVLPVSASALVVTVALVLQYYDPADLSPVWDRILMWLDPSGRRWLAHVWVDEDRGTAFYNSSAIGFDTGFCVSRIALLGTLLAGGVYAASQLRRRIREGGSTRGEAVEAAHEPPATLEDLRQPLRTPELLAAAIAVCRIELRALIGHPAAGVLGLLMFLATCAVGAATQGPFHTPQRLTPGGFAVGSYFSLVMLAQPLLIFSVAESFTRDRRLRLWELVHSAPVHPLGLVIGRLAANLGLLLVILCVVWCAGTVTVLSQGGAPLDARPFLVLWGVVLVPTLLPVMTLVAAIATLTGRRGLTCMLALATWGIALVRVDHSAVADWLMLHSIRWTDMGSPITAWAPVLTSRGLALAVGLYFLAFAAAGSSRRMRIRRAGRVRRPMLLLVLYLPVIILVAREGERGRFFTTHWDHGGRDTLFRRQDWENVPIPERRRIELDLTIDPPERTFRLRGAYVIGNFGEVPMPRLAVGTGEGWSGVAWTLNGEAATPERSGDGYCFELAPPLATGDELRLGFAYEGTVASGNRGYLTDMEFLLPGGVVLTDNSTSLLPLLLDDQDRMWRQPQPQDADEEGFEGPTAPLFGSARPFSAMVTIDSPPEYTMNSVGRLIEDRTTDGRRVRRFETDHPVIALNIVGGIYEERRGRRATVYHHPGHPQNAGRMVETLDAALDHFSEWFCPYPWAEIRLSEFPGLVDYAQGYPTNIPFSESMGFLSRPDPRVDPVFLVTAHEVAHQWWGNLVVPGTGGGANVLSEGLAHFSAILLTEELHGAHRRMEVCRWFESNYLEDRYPGWEKPLVELDPMFFGGGMSITYDKGGWAFWMLYGSMGRERFLEGIREFIAQYRENPDHPILEDFLRGMRVHADDPSQFDDTAELWFRSVSLPEFALTETRIETAPDGYRVHARLANRGTGRLTVTVAATRGTRFDRDGRPGDDYEEARVEVLVDEREPVEVIVECGFRPERLVVDPDVVVLQRGRSGAVVAP